jgi:hypothetical protein
MKTFLVYCALILAGRADDHKERMQFDEHAKKKIKEGVGI